MQFGPVVKVNMDKVSRGFGDVEFQAREQCEVSVPPAYAYCAGVSSVVSLTPSRHVSMFILPGVQACLAAKSVDVNGRVANVEEKLPTGSRGGARHPSGDAGRGGVAGGRGGRGGAGAGAGDRSPRPRGDGERPSGGDRGRGGRGGRGGPAGRGGPTAKAQATA